jgi:hypothetical protein
MRQTISKRRLWTSYILQGIVASFLFIGAVNNIVKTEEALLNSKALGYAESSLLPLAIVLLTGVVCYLVPRTCILGAVLLTAWFGGAVATHIIHGDAPLILVLPVLFAVLVWVAIGLRDQKVRAVIPFKQ